MKNFNIYRKFREKSVTYHRYIDGKRLYIMTQSLYQRTHTHIDSSMY